MSARDCKDWRCDLIRNETEYREAVKRIGEEDKRIKEQQKALRQMDLNREEIKRAMNPIRSFHERLREEVASYERLRRGEFADVRNFGGLGELLIALRISQGVSQRELAERLGVHESQVSRDERNEYRGITMERAQRILDALGVEVSTKVKKASGHTIGAV